MEGMLFGEAPGMRFLSVALQGNALLSPPEGESRQPAGLASRLEIMRKLLSIAKRRVF